ncbi:MAG: peptidoglycan-binding protein [Clostridia bacterium]|nr:peptidoglycan-binding protein [Clostridia bacterium]
MDKRWKALAVAAAILTLTAGGCGNGGAATATPVPTETLAPTIVVTPGPTQEATPTPEESEEATDSAQASSSSGSSSSSSSEVLKQGMEGEAVTEAQERLQSLGYLDKVTGYYGTDTERAVREFQQRNNLDSDGKIGPMSMEVLMSDDAKSAS